MDHPREGTGRDEPAPDLGSLIGLLAASPGHAELADPEHRRSSLYEALARSDDRMWREIGEQLRDGHMRLRDILRVDVYWQHLQDSLSEREDGLANTFRRAGKVAEFPERTDLPITS